MRAGAFEKSTLLSTQKVNNPQKQCTFQGYVPAAVSVCPPKQEHMNHQSFERFSRVSRKKHLMFGHEG